MNRPRHLLLTPDSIESSILSKRFRMGQERRFECIISTTEGVEYRPLHCQSRLETKMDLFASWTLAGLPGRNCSRVAYKKDKASTTSRIAKLLWSIIFPGAPCTYSMAHFNMPKQNNPSCQTVQM